MRRAWGIASIGAAACLVGTLSAVTPASAAPTTVVADYQMENDTGTTMADSAGSNDGVIEAGAIGAGLDTHAPAEGPSNFGYEWGALPANPNTARVVTVPDSSDLEPVGSEFAAVVRLNTTVGDGTILQKGTPTSVGGHWRMQLGGGLVSCLFRGASAQGATKANTPVDDGNWHTIRCEVTGTQVAVYVDGNREGRKLGSVGTLDNSDQLTVGGKVDCANVSRCEYFQGLVDDIQILKGGTFGNLPPHAQFGSDCSANDGSCTFDATASADTDGGTIDSYDWDFGGAGTQSGTDVNPTFAYDSPGTYTVKLIVTDNDGGTDSAVHTVFVNTGDPGTRPRQVTATAGNASATVSWLPQGTDPPTGTRQNYTATATPGGQSCTTPNAAALTCTVTGLEVGTSYTFRVRANTTVGPSPQSKASNAVTPFGKPSAPGSVGAKAGNHQATVTWTAAQPNGKPVTKYVVTRLPGGVTKAVDGSARKTVFKKLKNGTAYHFTIAAVNAAGRGPAATTKNVTPVGPPTKVTNVTAKGGNNSAVVKWGAAKPNGSPILHYKIVSSDGHHRVVGANARQVKMTSLKAGQSYKFRVRAINKVGSGPWSAWTKAVRVH
jgi:PKD repeat protein